jgi:hypothetical protein
VHTNIAPHSICNNVSTSFRFDIAAITENNGQNSNDVSDKIESKFVPCLRHECIRVSRGISPLVLNLEH